MPPDFLDELKVVASSPAALLAYVVVIAAWTIRTRMLVHPQRKAAEILAGMTSDEEKRLALRELLERIRRKVFHALKHLIGSGCKRVRRRAFFCSSRMWPHS